MMQTDDPASGQNGPPPTARRLRWWGVYLTWGTLMGSFYTVQLLRPDSTHASPPSPADFAGSVAAGVAIGAFSGFLQRLFSSSRQSGVWSSTWLPTRSHAFRQLMRALILGAILCLAFPLDMAIAPRPSWYVEDAAIVYAVGYAAALVLLISPVHEMMLQPRESHGDST